MPYSAGRMLAPKIAYSARNSAGRIYPSLLDIERFSIERRKTKTIIITPTNHKKRKQNKGPIRTLSKCMQPAPSAGKRVRARHDWFCFSLVEKVARIMLANHRAKATPKQTRNYFRHSIENRSLIKEGGIGYFREP